MEKGRIEDRATRQWYSIKIQFNSEEQWTKALKFMLTNLKWQIETFVLIERPIINIFSLLFLFQGCSMGGRMPRIRRLTSI